MINFHEAKLSIFIQKDHTQSCMVLARWGNYLNICVRTSLLRLESERIHAHLLHHGQQTVAACG